MTQTHKTVTTIDKQTNKARHKFISADYSPLLLDSRDDDAN